MVQQSADLLPQVGDLITLLITAVGVVAGYITIKNRFEETRRRQRNRRRENLITVIENGIEELGETYSDLYEYLFELHSSELNRISDRYDVIDSDYFTDSAVFDGSSLDERDDYRFPLVYRPEWVYSSNQEMDFELAELGECPDRRKMHKGDEVGEAFLTRFGIIQDYGSYFDFLQGACDTKVWEATTFDLHSVTTDSSVRLRFCEGNYRYFVQTYAALQKELYTEFLHENSESRRKSTISNKIWRTLEILRFKTSVSTGDSLILRNNLIDFDALEDYSDRPCKVGLNVLTIMKRSDGGHSILLHDRGDEQVEYPGFWHVVPAGTFQPHTRSRVEQQFKFPYAIFREFYEEILDQEEHSSHTSSTDPFESFRYTTRGHDKKNLSPINPGEVLFGGLVGSQTFDSWETDVYTISPTGFVIDITSFKPELTFVLYIKDAEKYELISDYFRTNWEADQIAEFDLDGDRFEGNAYDHLDNVLHTDEFLPSGAVAVVEGLNWFEQAVD